MTLRRYTKEELEFLREGYLAMLVPELTRAFNLKFSLDKSEKQITATLWNHRFKTGRPSRFQEGNVPWHKGTKGLKGLSVTGYKKGVPRGTAKPFGHTYISDGYYRVKVNKPHRVTGLPGRYELLQRVIYAREIGEIPPGYAVGFADGNTLNCSLDNLVLLSRAEMIWLNRNGYKNVPLEFRETMRATAKLITTAKKMERENV